MENVVSLPDYRREKRLGLTYTQVGDYLYPNIALSDTPDAEPLNRYGMMRKAFIKEHMRISHTIMLSRETLYPHCRVVQQQVEHRITELMEQLHQADPAPCKNQDSQAWVVHMTTLRATAEQTALAELIYDDTPLR